jgi:hypothetical protein
MPKHRIVSEVVSCNMEEDYKRPTCSERIAAPFPQILPRKLTFNNGSGKHFQYRQA